MSHTYSRRIRDLDGPAVSRSLAASVLGTLAVAMVCVCFSASGGASERPAAAEPAAGSHGTVTCSALAAGTGVVPKFDLSECTHKMKTDGRGVYREPGSGGVVKWASGQTTTLSDVNTSEAIGGCPPNGDLYYMTGTFTNSWGGSGTFAAGWCLSRQGPYLDYAFTGPFEI